MAGLHSGAPCTAIPDLKRTMQMITPNWFAPLALFFVWPAVTLLLYRTRPVAQATLWAILGAQLILPPFLSYKFQMIPSLDRDSISSFAALFGCFFIAQRRIKFLNRLGLAEVLILICIFSPVVTSLLNTDPVLSGGTVLPGVGIYDGLSAALSQFIMLLPFFLGRQFLRTSADNVEIFRTLVIAGLIYTLPMLFELRMSPILNIWIYGFSPGDLSQAFRDGGYRPVVFIGHGLSVAFFMMTTVLASTTLWRTRIHSKWFRPVAVTGYLSAMLILCKTLASILYATLSVPLILFTKPRQQLQIALVLTSIALIYPLLRTADLVPTRAILDQVASLSEDRAASLNTRFVSEEALLDRAHERFIFGWGRYGRNRNYGNFGTFSSTTDGLWIITVGTFGLVGFLGLFGLLALPVFRAASALRFTNSATDGFHLAALTLMVAINVFDFLPNSGLTPWTWLLVGALLGRTEALKAVVRQPKRLVSRPVIERSSTML